MKKDNNEKNNDIFESFMPDRMKEDPNNNLKKEKKMYSTIFIIICTLLLVANLIAMIINFCFSVQDGVTTLFVGFINCAISIFLLGLLITIAHNISKMTRATLFMCSKLMKDEKRFMEEQAKKKQENEPIDKKDNAKNSIAENKEDSAEKANSLNVAESSDNVNELVEDNIATVEAEVVIDEE